jgi:hypothetical protein
MTSFTPDPLATQYHFELANEGRDLSLAIYLKGHKAPDMFDYLPDTRIMDLLKTLEQIGYAVRLYDHGNSAPAVGVSHSAISQKMGTIQRSLLTALGNNPDTCNP